MTQIFDVQPSARRGGLGGALRWFIRILIYDMIITGMAGMLGVSRMVALLIFFGILIGIGIGGYILRKRMSTPADSV